MSGRSRRRTQYVGAALLTCLLATGCGNVPGLDTEAVETFLLQSQSSTYGDVEIGPAKCPGSHELRNGMTLDCTVAVLDAKVPYRVRLTDVHEKKVHAAVTLDAVVVMAKQIQKYVRSTLPSDFSSAEVTCGHEVIVTEVGNSIDCVVASGAQTKPLKVTVEDAEGHISIA
jgi:hypothetical protein